AGRPDRRRCQPGYGSSAQPSGPAGVIFLTAGYAAWWWPASEGCACVEALVPEPAPYDPRRRLVGARVDPGCPGSVPVEEDGARTRGTMVPSSLKWHKSEGSRGLR